MRTNPRILKIPVEFIMDPINEMGIDVCIHASVSRSVMWFWNSRLQNYNVCFTCPTSLESRNKYAFVYFVNDKRVNNSCKNGEYVQRMEIPYIRKRDNTSLDFLIYSRTVGIL